MGKIWKLSEDYKLALEQDKKMHRDMLDEQLRDREGFFWDRIKRLQEKHDGELSAAEVKKEKEKFLKKLDQNSIDYYNRLAAFSDMGKRLFDRFGSELSNNLINPEPELPILEMSNEDVEHFEKEFTALLDKEEVTADSITQFFRDSAKKGIFEASLVSQSEALEERLKDSKQTNAELEKKIRNLESRLLEARRADPKKWESFKEPPKKTEKAEQNNAGKAPNCNK